MLSILQMWGIFALVFFILNFYEDGPSVRNEVFVKATAACKEHGGLKRIYFAHKNTSWEKNLRFECGTITISNYSTENTQ